MQIDAQKYPPLNLPAFAAKVRREGEQIQIQDQIRRKYVKLTPEEWVRQHYVHLLTAHLGYPASRVQIEFQVNYHRLQKRPDIGVVDDEGRIDIIVECKAPSVTLDQDVFLQLSSYYKVLKPRFIVMTNGFHHAVGMIQPNDGKIVYIEELPAY